MSRARPRTERGSLFCIVHCALPTLLIAFSTGCGEKKESTAVSDRSTLRQVALPDLARLEESIQAQLRERYAALATQLKDPATPAARLGTEYGEMGKLLMAAEFHAPAQASFQNAEALAPSDLRWPYYLGHLYRAKGDIPNALAAFERTLGESALDQGRPEVAELLFTKALSLQPRSGAAHYGLGRTALANKDYSRAAQNLEQALALDSKATIIHYSLAMAYRGLGDPRRAELHLQQRGTLQLQPDLLKKALDEVLDSALTYERTPTSPATEVSGLTRPHISGKLWLWLPRGPRASQAGHCALLHG
jgi:tetratricopeptide (TPR) repeat protein